MPRIPIGRALEAVAYTNSAAEQICRQKERTEHHRLIDMGTLVIAQADRWFCAVTSAVRIGGAIGIQRVAGMQNAIAQRQCATRAKGHVIEHECEVVATQLDSRATRKREASDDESNQRVG